jgi:dihydrofolate reductase
MAELTLTTFLTLDGVMQAPGGPTEDTSGDFPYGGWTVPFFKEDEGTVIDEIFAKADAFLMGRTTYDIFSAYWPKITDPNDPIATKLNSLPKFVASRTRTTFSWNGTSHIQDVVKEVPDLKRRFAHEIQISGSGGLVQTLMENDFIDEYRLFIFPITLGTGKRLFGSGTIPGALKLVKSSLTNSGVIIAFYRRAGNLKTGSFELPPE